MPRHFLYLTNSRLVSLATRGKRIVARREFEVSGAGAAEFDRHLAGMAAAPTHLFIDLMEEDFRLDTIPHVGGRDREAILARKLAQIYRGTPYRHAVLHGRETEGRRDDRVIYTAVTNPEVLRPWLESLERACAPLEGVYSAAVFSGALLERLDLVFPHTLLVTFTPGGAMRQTYFHQAEIKFSRLTPVDLEEGQSLGAMIAEETTRTWQYLDSLRHFGPDDRLEVCVLADRAGRAGIQPELRDFAQIQYRMIDIEQVAARLGLKPVSAGASAEEVLVSLFLVRPAANHFASSEMRRHATLRRARLALNQAAAGVLVASIAWGGWSVARTFQGSAAAHGAEQQMLDLDREYEGIQRAMPAAAVGGSTMRDAVAFYNGSIKPFPSLPDFLQPVSQALQAHPHVRINQLSWQATDDARAMPPMTLSVPRQPPPVKALVRGGETPPPPGALDTGSNPPFPGGRYEVALMEGSVRVPANDFRGALEQVGRLAEEIGRAPGFRADVLESPLDVRSSIALQGRHGQAEPESMEARFVLRIVRERGGAA